MKRRRWFDIHSWLGVIAGLMLFVICWSGTVAVLSHEIDWLLDERLRVENREGATPASWNQLQAAVEQAYPAYETITLQAPLYRRFAVVAIVDTPQQKMKRVYLDPYTAQVRGETSYFNVQRFFRSLHMSLFDFGSGRMWGYWFVGAFSLVLLVMAVAPLVFYRRWWRGFFTLKTGRGARVFWSDAHKLAGVWTLVFAFLIALTGVWYLIEFFDVDFGYSEPVPVEGTASGATRPLDAVVDEARRQWPTLRVTSVTPAKGSYWGPVVRVEGQAEAWLVRNRANYLMLDAANGGIVLQQNARDVPWPARWVDTADPLHFGDFGGLWTKAIWFVFGLLLSGSALTGAYLHVQRLRSGSARVQWTGTALAMLVTAAVLVIAAWGGWREVIGYGPTINDYQVAPDVPQATALFLCGWTILTICILAAWAWFVVRGSRRPDSRSPKR